MGRVVTVKCPMALTLFLNIETLKPDIKVKLIKQTVALQNTNIMDLVEIKKDIDLKILGDIEVIEKEIFLKTINLFQEYTNLKVENISV